MIYCQNLKLIYETRQKNFKFAMIFDHDQREEK